MYIGLPIFELFLRFHHSIPELWLLSFLFKYASLGWCFCSALPYQLVHVCCIWLYLLFSPSLPPDWKCNFPMTGWLVGLSVRWSVSWSVCHNFLKECPIGALVHIISRLAPVQPFLTSLFMFAALGCGSCSPLATLARSSLCFAFNGKKILQRNSSIFIQCQTWWHLPTIFSFPVFEIPLHLIVQFGSGPLKQWVYVRTYLASPRLWFA